MPLSEPRVSGIAYIAVEGHEASFRGLECTPIASSIARRFRKWCIRILGSRVVATPDRGPQRRVLVVGVEGATALNTVLTGHSISETAISRAELCNKGTTSAWQKRETKNLTAAMRIERRW